VVLGEAAIVRHARRVLEQLAECVGSTAEARVECEPALRHEDQRRRGKCGLGQAPPRHGQPVGIVIAGLPAVHRCRQDARGNSSVLGFRGMRREGYHAGDAAVRPPLTRKEEIDMGLFKELNHVSITVTDVAKAREFYTGLLGLKRFRDRPSTSRHLVTASATGCLCISF
jgi:hypothetical protein